MGCRCACRYPQGLQARAVSVWADGSATAQWPNGDLAVTVTTETMPGQVEPQYRIFAAYRTTGNVAVSFDCSGGFAQHPNGSIMMNYSRVTGAGACYSSKGEVTARWRDAEPESWPKGLSGPCIELQLDACLGLQYLIPAGLMYVYFSCEGVKYRLVSGHNPGGATWPAGGGGARADREGEQEGAAPEDGAVVMPAPLFLKALDSQRVGLGRGTAGRAVKADARPVEERMDDVASITAALQNLDSSLQHWMQERAVPAGGLA